MLKWGASNRDFEHGIFLTVTDSNPSKPLTTGPSIHFKFLLASNQLRFGSWTATHYTVTSREQNERPISHSMLELRLL